MSKLPRSAKCEMFFGKVKNWFAAAANQPQTYRKPDANQDANHAANLPSTGRPQGRAIVAG
jgi:hypothetical protein